MGPLQRRDDGLKVLYLAGYMYSGSTILANVLGKLSGWFSAGELREYWSVQGSKSWPCACGRSLEACPFWTGVEQRLHSAPRSWDPEQVTRLSRHTRARNAFRLWLPGGEDRLGAQLGPYLDAQQQLYRAIAEQGDSHVVVDSSKAPLYGRMLSRSFSADLYVLHLVRDPRGVAHSVAKRAGSHRWHPRYGSLGIAMLVEWSWVTRQVERWGAGLGRRFMRMRYEDFIQDPQAWIHKIADLVGEDPEPEGLVVDGVVDLGEHHTLAGNVNRFDQGRVQLSGDFAWHSNAPVRRRFLSFLGARSLKRFGYPTATSRMAGAVREGGLVLGVLLNRWSSSVIRFVLNILIGRALGPAGVGTYYLFDSWQRLLAVGGNLGLTPIVLRDVSVLEGRGRHRAADQVLQRSLVHVSIALVGLTAAAFLLAPFLGVRLLGESQLAWVLPAAGIGAVFLGITQLVSRALNGRGRPHLSLALENMAHSVGLLLVLLGSLLAGITLSARLFVGQYLGLSAATAGLGLLLWRNGKRPPDGKSADLPAHSFHGREMATFWSLGMVTTVSTILPYLILPQMVSTAEIGLFGISQRFVTMAVTTANALTALFAPRFAKHFAEGDREALRVDLSRSQVYSLLAYLPFVLAYLVVPDVLLATLGEGFQSARGILQIMVFGQLVNAATGLAGTALQMTKDEGSLLRLNLAFLGISALAVGGLGWRFGLVGAAWGQSLALAGRHLTVYVRARAALRKPSSLEGA